MDAFAICYNRSTRQAWVTKNGLTVAGPVTAERGQRIIDVASSLAATVGVARTSNYDLVAAGSPLRSATAAHLED